MNNFETEEERIRRRWRNKWEERPVFLFFDVRRGGVCPNLRFFQGKAYSSFPSILQPNLQWIWIYRIIVYEIYHFDDFTPYNNIDIVKIHIYQTSLSVGS